MNEPIDETVMSPLTPKQQQVLRFLQRYLSRHGTAPTYGEIAEELGLADKKSIRQYLDALQRKGYLRRQRYGHRSIELIEHEGTGGSSRVFPLVGRIAAGQPLEAIENREYLDVGQMMALSAGKEHFLLEVSGDSMIEDGILDGDYVVVMKSATANNGDIVVALLSDGTATLKRYYREKNRIRLQPANAVLQPRYVRQLTIQGVVKGVIRPMVDA